MSNINTSLKTIPSQRIVGSNKELFIINYEGAVIEIYRTNNLYEPLTIQLNGKILDTIPSKQNKELNFYLADGSSHKLEVWNERINNSPFIKLFTKDGIAIVIDGIPVQYTLADPLSKLSKPKLFLWLLTAFLFFISVLVPFILVEESGLVQVSVISMVWLFLFIASLVAVLTYKSDPIRSVWIGIIIISIDLIYNIYFIYSTEVINIYSILFLLLRLFILFIFISSIKYLKSILGTKPNITQKTNKKPFLKFRFISTQVFTTRNILVSVTIISLCVGAYFGIPRLIEYINAPPLDRDNSIVFRNDLKLPELIPYRNGDKWGYCDKNKNIIIPAIYNRVIMPSPNCKYLVVSKNNKVGIIDKYGNKIIPFIYSSAYIDTVNENFIVSQDEFHTGVIGKDSEIIIPFYYKNIRPWKNYYIVSRDINGVINKALFSNDGKVLINFIYNELAPIVGNDDLFICSIAKPWKIDYTLYKRDIHIERDFMGIVNAKGDIILPLQYKIDLNHYYYERNNWEGLNTIGEKFFKSKNNLLIASKLGEDDFYSPMGTGIIDIEANEIIPFYYEEIYISDFTAKYYCVKKKERWGIVDSKNKVIIPFIYDYINITLNKNEIYFIAFNKDKGGLLNELGEVVIPFEYSFIGNFDSKNRVPVSKGLTYGIVDMNNFICIPFEYGNLLEYNEGLTRVRKFDLKELEYYINSNNIIDSVFIKSFTSSINIHPDYGSYGITFTPSSLSDQVLSPDLRKKFYYNNFRFITESYYYNYEEFAIKCVLGSNWQDKIDQTKYGYIDYNGNLVIDYQYDEAGKFKDGYAIVEYDEKSGLLNKSGKVIIPIKYDRIVKVEGFDLFKVRINNVWNYIDLNGVEYFED